MTIDSGLKKHPASAFKKHEPPELLYHCGSCFLYHFGIRGIYFVKYSFGTSFHECINQFTAFILLHIPNSNMRVLCANRTAVALPIPAAPL